MSRSLPNRIKYWRKVRGLTQAGLAERLGTTQATIARLEVGDQGLTVEIMQSVAEALEVQPADLLPLAVVSEIRDDVEEHQAALEPALAAAMAGKGLVAYRIKRDVLSGVSGLDAGSLFLGDQSEAAAHGLRDGDVVVARVECPREGTAGTVLRQYLSGGLLTTNRRGRNTSIHMADEEFVIHILAVMVNPHAGAPSAH